MNVHACIPHARTYVDITQYQAFLANPHSKHHGSASKSTIRSHTLGVSLRRKFTEAQPCQFITETTCCRGLRTIRVPDGEEKWDVLCKHFDLGPA